MSQSTTTADFDAMDIDTITTNDYDDDDDENDEYGTEILNDTLDDETFTIPSVLDDGGDDDDDDDSMGGDNNSITIARNTNATRAATVAASTVATNGNTGRRIKRSKIADIRSASRTEPISAKTAAVTTTAGRASTTTVDKNTKAATNFSVVTSANNFALDEMFDDISSRYDTCIVYALDECLTRGAYHVFAKWFYRYISKENLPGSMVVVGFSANVSHPSSFGRTNNYCSSAVTATATTAANRGVNLGGSIPVPYVRLDPSDVYAIFDFKRQTGYPAIVLLITLPASRLEMCLSCDGSILVQARHNMRRNMIEVAEVLQQLTRAYLNDLYTAVNAMNCNNNNDDENEDLLQGNCDGDYENDEIVDNESTVTAMNDPRRCCAGDLAKVDFEQRCDKNGNNCGDNASKYLTAASASSSSPALFSMMSPPAPKEHHEDRGDDEVEDEFTIATAISIPKDHHHRNIVTTTSISDNNNAMIDSSSDRSTTNNSINAIATAIGSGHTAATTIDRRHNISSTNSGSNANSGGNMTSQLRGQNHRILQQLQQMDRTLTETHPRDFVPIVHGETLDITIPSSAFYRY